MIDATGGDTLEGCIDGLYGDLLYGWVIDSASPDLRVVVELYLDDSFVAVTRADQPQAVQDVSVGDGLHGFSFFIPRRWLNQSNAISVRVANHGPWLAGRIDLLELNESGSEQTFVISKPFSISAKPPTSSDNVGINKLSAKTAMPQAAPTSRVVHDGGLLVQGWATDPHDPERHVGILVREGRIVHARSCANLRHPALVRNSSADHGFKLDLPLSLADGETHELEVENDLGETLAGSPLTVNVRSEGLSASLYKLWPGTKKSRQQPPFQLLLRLAQEQDKRAPQSLPFSAYSHWFELQQQEPLPPLDKSSPKVGALLLDEGEVSARSSKSTLKSLRSQNIKIQHIKQVPANQAVDGVEYLLQQQVEAVVVIRTGDRLAPEALSRLLAGLQHNDEVGSPAWIYPDCDQDDEQGNRASPWLKPAWDPDYFLGSDIFSIGALFNSDILHKALEYLAVEAHAASTSMGRHWQYMACALVAVTWRDEAAVAHLPQVLYHRAAGQPAEPFLTAADPVRDEALQWLATKMDAQAKVENILNFPGLKRVQWSLPAQKPKVSLIIPTRDQYTLLSRCLGSLLRYTDYPNVEIIVVDNDSQCERTLNYLDKLALQGVRIIRYPHPFNYSAINNLAVNTAKGSLIGLVNNDIEIYPEQGGWLTEMVAQLLRPGVGAVGAKLQWNNGMVQHGGVVVGVNGLAAHVGNNWMESDPGYLGNNQIVRQQSAVTAACLLTTKAAWDKVGGLNANDFAVNFNDVDYCLRLRRAGYRVIWTPFADLVHMESASRGLDVEPSKAARAQREQQNLRLHWTNRLQTDPSYHPGLSLDHGVGGYGGLKMPPNSPIVRFNYIS